MKAPESDAARSGMWKHARMFVLRFAVHAPDRSAHVRVTATAARGALG